MTGHRTRISSKWTTEEITSKVNFTIDHNKSENVVKYYLLGKASHVGGFEYQAYVFLLPLKYNKYYRWLTFIKRAS